MSNYAKELPFDKQQTPLQGHSSPVKALARYGTFGAVSSVITMTADTTVIEIGASGGAGVVLRWVPTTDTQASVIGAGASQNYDNFIPADGWRRFVVPIEKNVGTQSIQGMNPQNGLYQRYATIAVGTPTSSVLASEF